MKTQSYTCDRCKTSHEGRPVLELGFYAPPSTNLDARRDPGERHLDAECVAALLEWIDRPT